MASKATSKNAGTNANSADAQFEEQVSEVMTEAGEPMSGGTDQPDEWALEAEPGLEGQTPLTEVMSRAEKAYAIYLEAQQEVAKAYKVNELQLERAYKDAEGQANVACQQAIEQAARDYAEAEKGAEKALKAAIYLVRQSEQKAEEAYKAAMEQARHAEQQSMEKYKETIREARKANDSSAEQARKVCREAIEKAWESRTNTVERAWRIFIKDAA